MTIIAKAIKGKEFIYNAASAHAVSGASAEKIAAALNAAGYSLKPGEVWHKYSVYFGSNAEAYASRQAFKIYRGAIRRVCR